MIKFQKIILIDIYTDGLCLGYPTQAIRDFAEWYALSSAERKQRPLQEAVIEGAQTYKEPVPEFDFFPEHATDLQIQKYIQKASEVLRDFYASPWHQEISKKPLFRKMKYDRTRTRNR